MLLGFLQQSAMDKVGAYQFLYVGLLVRLVRLDDVDPFRRDEQLHLFEFALILTDGLFYALIVHGPNLL